MFTVMMCYKISGPAKSAVLESVVGKDFLTRGSCMVIRAGAHKVLRNRRRGTRGVVPFLDRVERQQQQPYLLHTAPSQLAVHLYKGGGNMQAIPLDLCVDT